MSDKRNLCDEGDGKIGLAGLGDQLGFLLRLAQLAVFKDLTAALKPFQLRPSDFSVLLAIADDPGLRQQEIARELGIQNPNLAPLLDSLVARGLVQRERAAEDKRAYALTLTGEGEALLQQARIAHGEHAMRLRALLTDDDMALLGKALRRIMTLGDTSGE